MHSTNYINTFIAVAEDTLATCGTVPAVKDPPTVAALAYAKIYQEPYVHTSDDILFGVFATRQGIALPKQAAARRQFFEKAQACLRASDLPKRYGWGIHFDEHGRVALVAMESAAYKSFLKGKLPGAGKPAVAVSVKFAMRSKR
jgi:Family of unknown function (DUF6157)